MKSHATVAAYLLQNEPLVEAVLADVNTAPVTEAERALLRFVEKVNADSVSIGPGDIAALRDAGWTGEAIYDAIAVCALFNFYNRWIDAHGVHALSDAEHRAGAPRLAAGYVRTPQA